MLYIASTHKRIVIGFFLESFVKDHLETEDETHNTSGISHFYSQCFEISEGFLKGLYDLTNNLIVRQSMYIDI